MSDRLSLLKSQEERIVVGLNCGTSLDAIDAAVCRIAGSGFLARPKIVEFAMVPLDSALREVLLRMPKLSTPEICDLNFRVGEAFAAAALTVLDRAGLKSQSPTLIGSHGVTMWHRPPRRSGEFGATLQIGDLSVIAERTGAVVVGDFRTADMAAGGQGAPLMPYLDYVLFAHEPGTIVLNLGGIANLTYVDADLDGVRAFDTGPANLPLNHVMRVLSRGTKDFDDEGRHAAEGRIDAILLDHLMSHRYVSTPPPKTTGREEFGEAWTGRLLETHAHLRLVDILATLTAFVARHVRQAVRDFIEPVPLRRVLVAGGGSHNLTLMRRLAREFDPVPVEKFPREICDPDAKEALLFAILANDRIFARPTNVPSATGAKWPCALGKTVF